MEGHVYSQWRWGGSKMEPRWACGQVVTDFHYFDEEQDPDPHLSENFGTNFRIAF